MPVYEISQLVDARGLTCPMPTLRLARAMLALAPGEILELEATDPGAARDVAAWARTTGHQLLESETDGAVLRLVVRHR